MKHLWNTVIDAWTPNMQLLLLFAKLIIFWPIKKLTYKNSKDNLEITLKYNYFYLDNSMFLFPE